MFQRFKNIFAREDYDFFAEESNLDELTLFQLITAGSCAGICEHLGLFPIDTMKTHMQSQRRLIGKFGMAKTARLLYRHEGLRRFYRGAGPIVVGCIPAHGAFFATYEAAKAALLPKDGKFHWITSFFIGAIAAFIHDTILTPMDALKQRMQLSGCKKSFRYYKEIIKAEGPLAFYRSLPITLLMNFPYSSLLVMINENLKIYFQPKKKKNTFLWYFICASIAGSVSSILTNPLDMMKTRLQTQTLKANFGEEQGALVKKVKYQNLITTAQVVWREEGILGFGKGVMPRAMQASVSSALSWVTYEIVKSLWYSLAV